jgi:hypothetical protein|nr:MAG TPA: hypothetical protein [Inoviridae sp.]
MLKIIEYIKDFFTFILELFKFIGNLLLSLVNILVKCVTFLVKVVSALPTSFVVACIALVIVSVLYKVLGREAQS